MGMPMVDKILTRHAAEERVRPGDSVVCDADMAVRIDIEFAAGMDADAKRVADPERVAIILDHAVRAPTIADAAGQTRASAFAKQFSVRRLYDAGRHGICHQVILEN